jgi:hypothetical protein
MNGGVMPHRFLIAGVASLLAGSKLAARIPGTRFGPGYEKGYCSQNPCNRYVLSRGFAHFCSPKMPSVFNLEKGGVASARLFTLPGEE